MSEVERVSQQLRETSAALMAARAEREEVCAMLHPPTGDDVTSYLLIEQ